MKTNGGKVTASEIPSLNSNQEETDTCVVLYYFYAHEQRCQFVRARVLLCYASNLKKICELFDTWAENEGRVIEITHLTKEFTPGYCAALLGLHAFARCYTTSSFKGIGKVKPLKILQKKALYQEVLKCLGEFWDIN